MHPLIPSFTTPPTATVPTASLTPSTEQIEQTKRAIATYIQQIEAHPDRRDGGYPYYQFHEAGTAIHGTVLMFHGFSAKPHQMWRLAEYLFANGFNVYQVPLAGHALIHPVKNWPQVDLKPEILQPLKQKISDDPVLQNFLGHIMQNPTAFFQPNQLQQVALIARLMELEPRLVDIVKAIARDQDADFDTYFTSSHLNYLHDAKDRLAELDPMPGPIYTVGLSVGGAVALALGAVRGDRIQRVVTYAPMLEVHGLDRRQYVNLAGPLDIHEFGWDPNLRFPVGALTAARCFGVQVVRSRESIQALRNTPVFMVLTENEDAADVKTNQDFFNAIGGEMQGHCYHCYESQYLVPHPMVDPTEISQQMSNRFWQSLYQETFRFLTTGTVDLANMANLEQVADLPAVVAVG